MKQNIFEILFAAILAMFFIDVYGVMRAMDREVFEAIFYGFTIIYGYKAIVYDDLKELLGIN